MFACVYAEELYFRFRVFYVFLRPPVCASVCVHVCCASVFYVLRSCICASSCVFGCVLVCVCARVRVCLRVRVHMPLCVCRCVCVCVVGCMLCD